MVDPSMIESLKSWVRPTNVSEVRSFVDLARYYRRFVKGFSSIAWQLTNLTKQNILFVWSDECEESFQKLKTLLTTAQIHTLPVEVLMQERNVIAYASRQLKVHERKVNVVGDALSRKAGSMSSLAHLQGKQFADKKLRRIRGMVLRGEAKEAIIDEEGNLRIKGRVKYEHQRPGGTLQRIPIPEWKLTKSAHFILVKMTYNTEKLAKLYISEIVRLHGVPHSIISDRDSATCESEVYMQERYPHLFTDSGTLSRPRLSSYDRSRTNDG
ncbi:uncharacterized protein [Solanum lycopersicum]|uniref:uncharacterized protein n=1 Tax=Solanum lycopersicum TaxID=4081 RepID=UPI003747C2D3